MNERGLPVWVLVGLVVACLGSLAVGIAVFGGSGPDDERASRTAERVPSAGCRERALAYGVSNDTGALQVIARAESINPRPVAPGFHGRDQAPTQTEFLHAAAHAYMLVSYNDGRVTGARRAALRSLVEDGLRSRTLAAPVPSRAPFALSAIIWGHQLVCAKAGPAQLARLRAFERRYGT